LVESAYDSDKNEVWRGYLPELKAPSPSQVSSEDYNIFDKSDTEIDMGEEWDWENPSSTINTTQKPQQLNKSSGDGDQSSGIGPTLGAAGGGANKNLHIVT